MKITEEIHMKYRDRGRENDKTSLTSDNVCVKSIYLSPYLFCMALDALIMSPNLF